MKSRFKSTLLTVLCLCLFAGPGWLCTAMAFEVDGIALPDTYPINGKNLVLNGAGTRYYSIFRVKVYSAGLYLPEKTSDANAILNSKETRVVRLEMRVDSKREDNQKAWAHYLESNCNAPCTLNAGSLAQFMQLQTNLHAGDTETYVFDARGLSILRNNKTLQTIADPEFARTVLASWIGKVPSTEALKHDLLGSP